MTGHKSEWLLVFSWTASRSPFSESQVSLWEPPVADSSVGWEMYPGAGQKLSKCLLLSKLPFLEMGHSREWSLVISKSILLFPVFPVLGTDEMFNIYWVKE